MKEREGHPTNQKGKKAMKTVDVVKMDKGYYVTKRYCGQNKGSKWCKTKKEVTEFTKGWKD